MKNNQRKLIHKCSKHRSTDKSYILKTEGNIIHLYPVIPTDCEKLPLLKLGTEEQLC